MTLIAVSRLKVKITISLTLCAWTADVVLRVQSVSGVVQQRWTHHSYYFHDQCYSLHLIKMKNAQLISV